MDIMKLFYQYTAALQATSFLKSASLNNLRNIPFIEDETLIFSALHNMMKTDNPVVQLTFSKIKNKYMYRKSLLKTVLRIQKFDTFFAALINAGELEDSLSTPEGTNASSLGDVVPTTGTGTSEQGTKKDALSIEDAVPRTDSLSSPEGTNDSSLEGVVPRTDSLSSPEGTNDSSLEGVVPTTDSLSTPEGTNVSSIEDVVTTGTGTSEQGTKKDALSIEDAVNSSSSTTIAENMDTNDTFAESDKRSEPVAKKAKFENVVGTPPEEQKTMEQAVSTKVMDASATKSAQKSKQKSKKVEMESTIQPSGQTLDVVQAVHSSSSVAIEESTSSSAGIVESMDTSSSAGIVESTSSNEQLKEENFLAREEFLKELLKGTLPKDEAYQAYLRGIKERALKQRNN